MNTSVLLLVFIVSFYDPSYGQQQKRGILYPRDSESRQTKSLDGIWNFRAEPKGAVDLGLMEEWFRQPLEKVGKKNQKSPKTLALIIKVY